MLTSAPRRHLLTLVLVFAILHKPIVRLGLMEAHNLRQGKICWESWGLSNTQLTARSFYLADRAIDVDSSEKGPQAWGLDPDKDISHSWL